MNEIAQLLEQMPKRRSTHTGRWVPLYLEPLAGSGSASVSRWQRRTIRRLLLPLYRISDAFHASTALQRLLSHGLPT